MKLKVFSLFLTISFVAFNQLYAQDVPQAGQPAVDANADQAIELPEDAAPRVSSNNLIHSSLYNRHSAGLGVSNYSIVGDFSSFLGKKVTFDFGFNAFYNYQLSASLGVILQYSFGQLSGFPDNSANQLGDLNGKFFETNIQDVSLQLAVNLNNLILDGEPMGDWQTNLYLGMGYALYSNKVFDFNNNDREIPGAANDGLQNVTFITGIGQRYRINSLIDLEGKLTYLTMSGDLLDAVRSTYRDLPDGYVSLSLNTIFKFGNAPKALQWVSPAEDAYQQLLTLENKVKRLSRLAIDTDDDGVSDFFDKDNETIEGEKVAGDGTALDLDRDGIADYEDEEPLSNIGRQVLVDEKGVEIDTDNDGIPDSKDLEITRERDIVNFQGISVGGVTVPGGGVDRLDYLLPVIYFESNQYDVNYADYGALVALSRMLKLNPNYRIRIAAFADNKGSRPFNKKLTQRRAESVIEFLVKFCGIDVTRFEVLPHGKDRSPFFESENYKRLNRRVEFKILREQE